MVVRLWGSADRQNMIILLGIRALANGTNATAAWVGLTCQNENMHSFAYFAERQRETSKSTMKYYAVLHD